MAIREINFGEVIDGYCPGVLLPIWTRLRKSPLGYRIVRGALWSVLGLVIARVSGLLASVLLARLLGREVFGEYGAIQNTISMFQVFGGMGVGVTAAKFIAETRVVDPLRTGRIARLVTLVSFVSGLLLAIAVTLGAKWISADFLNAPQLEAVVVLAAIALAVSVVVGSQNGILTGFEAFRTVARNNTYCGIISLPFLVVGAWLGGLNGAVVGMILSVVANCCFGWMGVRDEADRWKIPLRWTDCFREWRVLWHFGLPALLAELFYAPVNWLCMAILVHQQDGYAEMGLLQVANQWRTIILFLPGTLGALVLPVLSNLRGQGDSRGMKKVFWAMVGLNSAIAMVAALVLALCSPWIMMAYGSDYADGKMVLVVMAIAAVLMVTASIIGNVLYSMGRMWTNFSLTFVWGTVTLGVTWMLREQGAMGVAIGTLAGLGVHLLNLTICLWRIMKSDSWLTVRNEGM